MLVHLMLELYNCDRSTLSNEPLIRRVLDEYPARVDMEKVSPVHLYDIETSNPLDAGLSGFVVIARATSACTPGPSTARSTSTSARARNLARRLPFLSRKRCS